MRPETNFHFRIFEAFRDSGLPLDTAISTMYFTIQQLVYEQKDLDINDLITDQAATVQAILNHIKETTQ